MNQLHLLQSKNCGGNELEEDFSKTLDIVCLFPIALILVARLQKRNRFQEKDRDYFYQKSATSI